MFCFIVKLICSFVCSSRTCLIVVLPVGNCFVFVCLICWSVYGVVVFCSVAVLRSGAWLLFVALCLFS